NRIGVPAPIGGQVTARSVVLGQTVAPDAELFRVANLGRVAINLTLSPADAGKVRAGMPVEVRSGDRRAEARIGFVSPVLDEATRLVPAVALLENGGAILRPGEPVTVAIRTGATSDAITISESALQTVEGRTVVFIRTAEGFRAAPVAVTSRGGGQATVTGLSGREQVAGKGSFTLKAELGKGEAEHGGH
ncbi:efflux RND transporter periplasmic adaptor subunit, partial [Sphingopyxis sp. HXXIV]